MLSIKRPFPTTKAGMYGLMSLAVGFFGTVSVLMALMGPTLPQIFTGNKKGQVQGASVTVPANETAKSSQNSTNGSGKVEWKQPDSATSSAAITNVPAPSASSASGAATLPVTTTPVSSGGTGATIPTAPVTSSPSTPITSPAPAPVAVPSAPAPIPATPAPLLPPVNAQIDVGGASAGARVNLPL